jgi:hypothetical protein
MLIVLRLRYAEVRQLGLDMEVHAVAQIAIPHTNLEVVSYLSVKLVVLVRVDMDRSVSLISLLILWKISSRVRSSSAG